MIFVPTVVIKFRNGSIILAISLGLLTAFVFCDSFFNNAIINGLGKIRAKEELPGSFSIPPGAYQQTTILKISPVTSLERAIDGRGK